MLDLHHDLKKKDWRGENADIDQMNILEDMGKDLFKDEDDEENDYNILYDLNDYNKNSQPTASFTSKSAFKSKLFSKGRMKVKLK